MKKKSLRILLVVIGLLVILGATTALTGYQLFFAPKFHPQRTAYILIDRNDNADSVFHKVEALGKASGMRGFRWLAQWKKYPQRMHTGRFAIRPGDNAYDLFGRIYRGFQEPTNLTIGSVRTLDRLARNIGRQLMIDSVEIAACFNDTLLQRQFGYTTETLPALFIPNTYQVYWNISTDELMARLQKEHNRFWNKQRKEKAEAIGLTPIEVSTLASIVEEETNNAAEKSMVAGLYLNRLKKGMPLQADPTVKFALQEFGLRRITNEHLRVQSPYNTYQNPGLPPGPIRIPTPEGLDAVLNYTHHNYLYMCAKEDFSGTHNFASTLAEHNRNAQRYWNALNKRKIYR